MTFDMNDLTGILFLVLFAVPTTAASNIDCRGKGFHCVNSTHFMICVDLGIGVSTTIDDFVIRCPPTTVCHELNKYECEFPKFESTTPTLQVIGVFKQSDTSATIAVLNSVSPTEPLVEISSASIEKNTVTSTPRPEEITPVYEREVLKHFKEYTGGDNKINLDETVIIQAASHSTKSENEIIKDKNTNTDMNVMASPITDNSHSHLEPPVETAIDKSVTISDTSLSIDTTTSIDGLLDFTISDFLSVTTISSSTNSPSLKISNDAVTTTIDQYITKELPKNENVKIKVSKTNLLQEQLLLNDERTTTTPSAYATILYTKQNDIDNRIHHNNLDREKNTRKNSIDQQISQVLGANTKHFPLNIGNVFSKPVTAVENIETSTGTANVPLVTTDNVINTVKKSTVHTDYIEKAKVTTSHLTNSVLNTQMEPAAMINTTILGKVEATQNDLTTFKNKTDEVNNASLASTVSSSDKQQINYNAYLLNDVTEPSPISMTSDFGITERDKVRIPHPDILPIIATKNASAMTIGNDLKDFVDPANLIPNLNNNIQLLTDQTHLDIHKVSEMPYSLTTNNNKVIVEELVPLNTSNWSRSGGADNKVVTSPPITVIASKNDNFEILLIKTNSSKNNVPNESFNQSIFNDNLLFNLAEQNQTSTKVNESKTKGSLGLPTYMISTEHTVTEFTPEGKLTKNTSDVILSKDSQLPDQNLDPQTISAISNINFNYSSAPGSVATPDNLYYTTSRKPNVEMRYNVSKELPLLTTKVIEMQSVYNDVMKTQPPVLTVTEITTAQTKTVPSQLTLAPVVQIGNVSNINVLPKFKEEEYEQTSLLKIDDPLKTTTSQDLSEFMGTGVVDNLQHVKKQIFDQFDNAVSDNFSEAKMHSTSFLFSNTTEATISKTEEEIANNFTNKQIDDMAPIDNQDGLIFTKNNTSIGQLTSMSNFTANNSSNLGFAVLPTGSIELTAFDTSSTPITTPQTQYEEVGNNTFDLIKAFPFLTTDITKIHTVDNNNTKTLQPILNVAVETTEPSYTTSLPVQPTLVPIAHIIHSPHEVLSEITAAGKTPTSSSILDVLIKTSKSQDLGKFIPDQIERTISTNHFEDAKTLPSVILTTESIYRITEDNILNLSNTQVDNMKPSENRNEFIILKNSFSSGYNKLSNIKTETPLLTTEVIKTQTADSNATKTLLPIIDIIEITTEILPTPKVPSQSTFGIFSTKVNEIQNILYDNTEALLPILDVAEITTEPIHTSDVTKMSDAPFNVLPTNIELPPLKNLKTFSEVTAKKVSNNVTEPYSLEETILWNRDNSSGINIEINNQTVINSASNGTFNFSKLEDLNGNIESKKDWIEKEVVIGSLKNVTSIYNEESSLNLEIPNVDIPKKAITTEKVKLYNLAEYKTPSVTTSVPYMSPSTITQYIMQTKKMMAEINDNRNTGVTYEKVNDLNLSANKSNYDNIPNNNSEKYMNSTDHKISSQKQNNETSNDPNIANIQLHTSKKDKNTNNATDFDCLNLTRGRYADKKDCRIFYTCVGKLEPIVGMCPNDTVFSEINKQCTRNFSHCVRNNQFRCLLEGRFTDYLIDNIYYICVKNLQNHFIRYKLQCNPYYHLNKVSVRCEKNAKSSTYSASFIRKNSEVIRNETLSELDFETSEKTYNTNFECEAEGNFPHLNDCKKYYVCYKAKDVYRRMLKTCASGEVYVMNKKMCVKSDSAEC